MFFSEGLYRKVESVEIIYLREKRIRGEGDGSIRFEYLNDDSQLIYLLAADRRLRNL